MQFEIQHIQKKHQEWIDDNYIENENERKFSEILTNALKNENQIIQILKVWDSTEKELSIRQLQMNFTAYQEGLKFGFNEIKFNEYGWIDNEDWVRNKQISFHDKNSRFQNSITLGKGKNEMWSYAIYFTYPNGGGAHGLSVFNKAYESEDLAIEFGLKELIQKIGKYSRDNAEMKKINRNIENNIAHLTKVDSKNQLYLF